MADRIESRMGQAVKEDVGRRFWGSLQGRRFSATHQTPATNVTGQTSFSATTPTFMLYQAAAANRLVIDSINLSQSGTVAGGDIGIVVAIEDTNRYSTGGTAVTPVNINPADDTASVASFRYNPTASAAGAATRYIYNRVANADTGTISLLDIRDELILPATASLLVYTFAGTTGPSWKFEFTWYEEVI